MAKLTLQNINDLALAYATDYIRRNDYDDDHVRLNNFLRAYVFASKLLPEEFAKINNLPPSALLQ